ncbi:MAG: glycosyltransferase [Acidimicrobiales bacterium]
MEDQLAAPPVVAVVVARSPGPWFDATLTSLAAQDYPNLSVLVVDAGATEMALDRVGSVLPEAYVRRTGAGSGWAAVANDALVSVEGSTFLLFCHEDLVADSSAVSLLVDEALRSNAGVLGPKVVETARPDRLLDVGLAVDKTGAASGLAEAGELDQEQHDAVRDVFAVSPTCLLIRCDLFATLGGFDEAMAAGPATLDLCWRAQVAGARVLVAPQARVGHGFSAPLDPPGSQAVAGSAAAAEVRGHVRAALKNYSAAHLVRVVPQMAVLTGAEMILAGVRGHGADAANQWSAWTWNLSRRGDLVQRRRAVSGARTVPDAEVRRLQARGSLRLARRLAWFRPEERAQALLSAGEELVESVWKGPARAAAILLVGLLLAWLVGSRDLIRNGMAPVGDLAPLPSPASLWRHYLSGWRATGMGAPGPAPPVFAVLGLVGGLAGGQMGLVQTGLLLAAWPVALVGMWRLTRPLDSVLAQTVGAVAYLVLPLPYNALARGQIGGLVAYAAFPWLMLRLARAANLAPYGSGRREAAGDQGGGPRWITTVTAGLALTALVALVALSAPSVPVVLAVVAVSLAAASAVVGGLGTSVAMLTTVAMALAGAVILLGPWAWSLLVPSGWSSAAGVARSPVWAPGFGQLLRFEVGPLGAGPLGWAVIAVAALPLVVGRSWRLAWAARAWVVALACVGMAWLGGRGWFPLRLDAPDVWLAPAAVSLALAAALGAASFENDLRGYRFGWRQGGSVLAGGLLALATLPVLGAAAGGRWGQPSSELAEGLAVVAAEEVAGEFRVLWIGDPAALPLGSWPLGDGLAFATSRNGLPSATDAFPGPATAATRQLGEFIGSAGAGGTARLGSQLAPMAVRFIVLPTLASASTSPSRAAPLPAGLARSLASQLDLRTVVSGPEVTVYRNEAWVPVRTFQADGASDPVSAPPVLPVLDDDRRRGDPGRFNGFLPGPGTLSLAESTSPGWGLTVGGRPAERLEPGSGNSGTGDGREVSGGDDVSGGRGGGLGNAFTVSDSGPARLRFTPGLWARLTPAFTVAAWVALGLAWARLALPARRRRGDPDRGESDGATPSGDYSGPGGPRW